jgi:hypothetical protein
MSYTFALHGLGPGPLGLITNDLFGMTRTPNEQTIVFKTLRLVCKDMSTAVLPLAPKFTLRFDNDDENIRMPMYMSLVRRMQTLQSKTRVHLHLEHVDDIRRCMTLLGAWQYKWADVLNLCVTTRSNVSWLSYVAMYFPSLNRLDLQFNHNGGHTLRLGNDMSLFERLQNLFVTGLNGLVCTIVLETHLNLHVLNIQNFAILFNTDNLDISTEFSLRHCYVYGSLPKHMRVSNKMFIRGCCVTQPALLAAIDQESFAMVHTARLDYDMAEMFVCHPQRFRSLTHATIDTITHSHVAAQPPAVNFTWANVFNQGPKNLERLAVILMDVQQFDALIALPRLRHLEITPMAPDTSKRLHDAVQLLHLESLTVNFAREFFRGVNVASSSLSMCAYVASLRTLARARGIRCLTLRMYNAVRMTDIRARPANDEGVHFFTILDGPP